MQTQSMEVWAGENISNAITQAIAMADKQSVEVYFEFNNVQMVVRGDSIHQSLLRDFHRFTNKLYLGVVGPYPPTKLSPEQLKADKAMLIMHTEQKERAQLAVLKKKYEPVNTRDQSKPTAG